MRRLAGSIVAALAFAAVASCSDTQKAEGPAGAAPAIEAMIKVTQRLVDHLHGVSPGGDYTAIPTTAIEQFGATGALAAAGDVLRLQRYETAAALTARDLTAAVLAGKGATLSDSEKDQLLTEASSAAYDPDELATRLKELVTAILFMDSSAKDSLARTAATIDQFSSVQAVSDVATAIAAKLADAPRDRVTP